MAGESSLSKLPPLAKAGIVVGVLALAAVAYFVVFYGDIASSIKAAQNHERQLRKELADARKAEFAYQKDLAELADRQQRQRELNKILPATTEYPAFLSAVQSVANVSGVTLSAWTPEDEIPEKFYARVPMKLELTGRYHQVARFFYGVGQLDRIINMENISITDPELVGDDVVVKVNVLATAFHSIADTGSTDKQQQRGAAQGQKK